MGEPHEERPIAGLDSLRAPRRTEAERRRARERILAAVEPLLARREHPATSWEVLAGWARPGLVAASVALLILAGALQSRHAAEPPPEPVALHEVLASGEGGQVLALLVAINEPDAEAVAAAAFDREAGNGGGQLGNSTNSGEGQGH